MTHPSTRHFPQGPVLGVFAEGPNPAACVIVDGHLVAFLEEERVCRVKAAADRYPRLAIAYCLREAGVNPGDISAIAFGWDATKYVEDSTGASSMSRFYDFVGTSYNKDETTLLSERRILAHFQPSAIRARLQHELVNCGDWANVPPITYVPHHHAHAASAFYCSGFDSAAVIVADGSGEELTTSLWCGTGRSLRCVDRILIPHSLGWFYAAFTEYLGFTPYCEEGKLMALAAYGRENRMIAEAVQSICEIHPEKSCYSVDPYFTFFGSHSKGRRYTDRLVEVLGEPRRQSGRDEIDPFAADLALAVQTRLEAVFSNLVRRWMRSTGERNLCVAGGVALNCRLNGSLTALQQEGVFTAFFAQPASNDAGSALGAAQVVATASGSDVRFSMKHAAWGPVFTDAEIEQVLVRNRRVFTRVDAAMAAAHLLAAGLVIGWFQGRSELGPRALGNRSILASPMSPDSPRLVNTKLKHRERWRPFAPSILDDVACTIVDGADTAYFMIRSFKMREDAAARLPAVVHVDRSTRPQVVTRDGNPLFWRLLYEYRRLTGEGVLLNTSFNGSGEPIVCSPDDALRTFSASQLDALVIGSYAVFPDDIGVTAQCHSALFGCLDAQRSFNE